MLGLCNLTTSLHVRLPFSLALRLLPLAFIKCCDFRPISAGLHAAPTPAMVFCPVVEVEHAGRVFTLLHVGWIAITQQIGRRVSHRPKQLAGLMNFQNKLFSESLSRWQDFRMPVQF